MHAAHAFLAGTALLGVPPQRQRLDGAAFDAAEGNVRHFCLQVRYHYNPHRS